MIFLKKNKLRKIKIGIDARAISDKITGIGRVVFEISQVLAKELSDADFYLYAQKGHLILPEACKESNWHVRMETCSFFKKYFSSGMWLKWRSGCFCKKDDLDIYLAFSTLAPVSLSKKTKLLTVVHDLNHLYVPESMSWLLRVGFKFYMRKDLSRSDAIVSVSQGTADKIKKHFDLDVTAVIYPGVVETFLKPAILNKVKVLKKFNLARPFILSVATQEPRKNLEMLIQAFKYLANLDLDLVLVGGAGWKAKNLKNLVEETPGVKHLGFVSDDELRILYEEACLFAFPSIYEGYGSPVGEALSVGTPVVLNNIQELRESSQGCAYFCKDLNVGELAETLALAVDQSNGAVLSATKNYKPVHWFDSGKAFVEVVFSVLSSSKE